MRSVLRNISIITVVAVLLLGILQVDISKSSDSEGLTRWTIHDMSRPQPPVVTPGEVSIQSHPGRPPSDAIVLFDGKESLRMAGG